MQDHPCAHVHRPIGPRVSFVSGLRVESGARVSRLVRPLESSWTRLRAGNSGELSGGGCRLRNFHSNPAFVSDISSGLHLRRTLLPNRTFTTPCPSKPILSKQPSVREIPHSFETNKGDAGNATRHRQRARSSGSVKGAMSLSTVAKSVSAPTGSTTSVSARLYPIRTHCSCA